LNRQRGREERAKEYWNKALVPLESSGDEGSSFHKKSRLSLVYAGLGRKKEAVRLAKEILVDFPLSWDAVEGTFVLEMAALTFVKAGEYEATIDQLELLLSVPSLTSRAMFRIDPAWDPLRDHPRFRKLVEGEP
jgi:serine/threonine-protein kinase